MTKRIYTLLLTAVLIYGAFFSVMAEIAFAEELAKDAETKTEAASDPKESTQPSSSGSSSSEGDTSDNSYAADKKSSGAGDGDGSGTKVDDSVSPSPDDQKRNENNDQNEGGSSPSSSDGQGDGEVIEEEPASGGLDAGEGTVPDNTNKTDQVNPQTIVVPAYEEPVVKDSFGFTDSRTYKKDGDYTRQVESSGAIRYKGFFHIFDKNAFGTEYLIIRVVCRSGQHCSEHQIIHYSDGLCEGLPKGFRVDRNDLIIDGSIAMKLLKENDCMLSGVNSMDIEIIGNGLLSSVSSDPDDASYEPAKPNAVTRTEKGDSNPAPSVEDDAVGYVSATVSSVENANASAPSENLANDTVEASTDIINSVLSSYQDSGNGSVMDATNDNDSPINATTAMLAGVAAMFLITMALVIVPKV